MLVEERGERVYNVTRRPVYIPGIYIYQVVLEFRLNTQYYIHVCLCIRMYIMYTHYYVGLS